MIFNRTPEWWARELAVLAFLAAVIGPAIAALWGHGR